MIIAFLILAGLRSGVTLPPVEFDHEYRGDLYEIIQPIAEIHELCSKALKVEVQVVACSYSVGSSCIVYLPKVEEGIVSSFEFGRIRRHEIGHCNGWPASHLGARE